MTCVQNSNTNGPCPRWTYNATTNQLATSTGCTYDAAGNLTKDCSTASNHTYQWDAEGRVGSVDSGPTWGFTYNAVGDRAQWAYTGGADQHIFDPAGTSLGVYGAWDVVWLGGRVLAVYEGSDTYFFHVNNLSSAEMLTNHTGASVEDVLFYPWGQNTWKLSGSGGYDFAGMPYYDTKTSTNPAMFRFYSQNLGRWHSPDPLGGDITNPQSLNRYPYVMNNPTTSVDPLGLQNPCPTVGPGGGYACTPEQGAQTNLWSGGGGTVNWDEFSLLFLSYNAPLFPGWSPLGDYGIAGPTYWWQYYGNTIGMVTTWISFGSSVDYFYYTQYLVQTPLQSPTSQQTGPVIGPQKPPTPPPPPNPAWERAWTYAGCVQNPDAYGVTSNENSTGAIQGTWYAPTGRSTGPQTVPISPGPPTGVNFLAGAAANALPCAKAAGQ
jgi:RHS repeat-associated protein